MRPPLRASVVSVIDGDTFNVRLADGSEERVRFLNIDAPEMYPPGADPECYAMEAHRRVEGLVPPGGPVWLTFDSVARDRYGRSLAHVFAGDRPVAGLPDWINLRLVQEGYARSYVFPDNATFRGTFEGTEAEAAAAGRGLWAACPP
ncbi:MAG: hypothetical protein A2516_10935 [Alphaproteobacteria bacterium RIFOXYD12_FULL_60_8]|nr:MAG: hypothetical protein A2516_10935 [Alphaproteobacteria bacterium RIFOXYD12_FULL_60_8]